jgi:UTP--glucose-1-phosphate uridylyltransferase
MYGDDLTVELKPGSFLSRMIDTYNKYRPAIIIAVKDVGRSEIGRFGCVQYVDDSNYPHRFSAILEKLPAEFTPSTFAQSGRFVVSSKVFSLLENQPLSKDNELWFSDAENCLAQTDVAMTESYGPDADWITTGDPLRWLKANIVLALKNPEYQKDLLQFFNSL